METFDLTIKKETEEEDLIQVIRHVKPEWNQEFIRFEKMKGGIINTMYCCWCDEELNNSADGRPEKLVVRIYMDFTNFDKFTNASKEQPSIETLKMSEMKQKREEAISHKKEIKNLEHVMGTGIGPELIALFNNGLCYRYIYGTVLDPSSIRTEEMIPYVTKLLARLHSLPLTSGGSTWDLDDLKMMTHVYPPQFKDLDRVRRLLEIFPDKESIWKEIDVIKNLIKDIQSPMVFAHNDSKGENFIWDAKEGILKMVDFEHSSNNSQASELGSHFVLYNDVRDSKPNQYPSREFQLRWLRMYLNYWYEFTGKNPEEITEKDVETLYVHVNKYAQKIRFQIGIGCLFLSVTGIFDTYEFCLQLIKDYFHFKDFVHNL